MIKKNILIYKEQNEIIKIWKKWYINWIKILLQKSFIFDFK